MNKFSPFYVNKFFIQSISPFSNSKSKSYYQILEVKINFTNKQLRSKFLKKARQLHPDHNKSQKAQQEFKIIKQAYETLKDPHKKYMYDTGISVQPGQQTELHQQFQQTGRKYYENRWYKYEKSKYKDARDQFYEKRNVVLQQNPYRNRIILFLALIVGVFGYDYYFSRTHKTQMENKMAKQLIQNSIQINQSNLQEKKKTIIMRKYIQARSKEHAVQE